jgi:hypothetical protein
MLERLASPVKKDQKDRKDLKEHKGRQEVATIVLNHVFLPATSRHKVKMKNERLTFEKLDMFNRILIGSFVFLLDVPACYFVTMNRLVVKC